MKKRFFSLMLVLSFVFSSIPVIYAQSVLDLSVTADKNSAAAGEEITFRISAKNANQVDRIQCAFDYDEKALEYVDTRFLIPNVQIKQEVPKESKVGLAIILKQPFDGSAEVADLTFKVKDQAESGKLSYGISNITCGNGSAGVFDEAAKPEINIVGTTHFTLETDKVSAMAGDTVTLSIKSNIERMSALQFVLDYPEEIFSLEGGEFSKEISGNAMMAEFEKATKKAVFVSGSDLQTNGTIFTAVFKVRENAAEGNQRISIQSVKLKAAGEDIQIEKIKSGDINIHKPAQAEPEITLTADRAAAAPGNTINVVVGAKALTAFTGMQFVLNYDPNVFDLGNVQNLYPPALISEHNIIEPGKVKFVFAAKPGVDGDQDFFQIPLLAKAESESSIVSVSDLKAPGSEKTPQELNLRVSEGTYDAKLTVSRNKERVSFGDEITYSFDMNGVSQAIELTAEYDPDKLEAVSSADGILEADDINLAFSENQVKAVKVFDLNNKIPVNGNLFRITFRVKDGASIGNTDLDVSLKTKDAIEIVKNTAFEIYDNAVAAVIAVAGNQKIAARGNEVQFDVNVDTASAIDGMQMAFEFDAESLEFVSSDVAAISDSTVASCKVAEPGKLGIAFTLKNARELRGKLFTVTFKVKEDAQKGITSYSITNPKLVNHDGANIQVAAAEPLRIVNRFGMYQLSAANTTINQNEEFDVVAFLNNADDAEGVQFDFDYDSAMFDYVGYEEAEIDTTFGSFEPTTNRVLYTFAQLRSDDSLKIITLKLKSKGLGGDSDIKLVNARLPVTNGADVHIDSPFDIRNLLIHVKTNQEYADAVIEKINAIGEVTLESGAAIEAAETAYNELTDDQKALVNNHETLTNARTVYNKLIADRAAADAVIEKINAIGEVTLESGAAIEAAEAAYNALTDDQKALVNNYDVLANARTAYDKLVTDRAAADAVIEKINAIGEVTLESGAAIEAAETAYNELTDDQKALVNNYETLTNARSTYEKLVADRAAADAVIEKINAIGEVTLESGAAIEAAETAYNELTDDQKLLVNNYEILTNARTVYDKLTADKAAVDSVIALIDAIGTPDINSLDAITKAQEEYDKLSDELKERVTNKEALDNAKNIYAEQKQAVDQVIEMINKLEEPVTIDSKAAIEAAEAAYHAEP